MDIQRMKDILRKAISVAPTTIVIKRNVKVSDGMGGYTIGATPSTVATITGSLDNTGKKNIFISNLESGKVFRDKNQILIIEYSSSFLPAIDDFFTINSETYKILNVTNSFNMNVLWECELEVVKDV